MSNFPGGKSVVKDYISSRAVLLAEYIIETKATVRKAAKQFNISKSTVHTEGVILKLFTG